MVRLLLTNEIIQIISEEIITTNIEITKDTDLSTINLDSFDKINILTEIEQKYDIEFEQKHFKQSITVTELSNLVESLI